MSIVKRTNAEPAARSAFQQLSSLKRICCLILALIVVAPSISGQTSKAGRGVAKGTVRSHGEPVSKAKVVVFGPPYTLSNSFVVPIITRRLVGTVSYDAPPTTLQVYLVVKTDKKGRYLVNLRAGRSYELCVTLPTNNDVTINKMVTIEKGQKLPLDFDFSAKWGEAEQSSESFLQSLNQVVAAAKEVRPMRSILFTPFGDDTSFWVPTVILPGADACYIVGLNSMKLDGQDITLPMYICNAKYETKEAADAAYRGMSRFVTEKMGWKAMPGKTPSETTFEANGLPLGDEVSLELTTDGKVSFVYTTVKRALPSGSKSMP